MYCHQETAQTKNKSTKLPTILGDNTKITCSSMQWTNIKSKIYMLVHIDDECYDICDLMLGTYVKLELTNRLTKHILLVIE